MAGPVKNPSQWLTDVLMGRVMMDDAPPAIQSCARLPIYQAARQIIAEPEAGARRNMLGKIPAPVRPYVEAEVKRLWPDRHALKGKQ